MSSAVGPKKIKKKLDDPIALYRYRYYTERVSQTQLKQRKTKMTNSITLTLSTYGSNKPHTYTLLEQFKSPRYENGQRVAVACYKAVSDTGTEFNLTFQPSGKVNGLRFQKRPSRVGRKYIKSVMFEKLRTSQMARAEKMHACHAISNFNG